MGTEGTCKPVCNLRPSSNNSWSSPFTGKFLLGQSLFSSCNDCSYILKLLFACVLALKICVIKSFHFTLFPLSKEKSILNIIYLLYRYGHNHFLFSKIFYILSIDIKNHSRVSNTIRTSQIIFLSFWGSC